MNPKKRYRLYRELARLKLFGALSFIAPPHIYQFLKNQYQ